MAAEKGKAYLEGVDPKSDWGIRVRCCGTWKIRDCWVAAAQDKCDQMQTEQVHNLPYTFIPNLERDCKDYPPGSSKCSFPVWLIVLIVVVVVTLLGVGVFFGVRFYRRRREQRSMRSRPVQIEKVKPVDV